MSSSTTTKSEDNNSSAAAAATTGNNNGHDDDNNVLRNFVSGVSQKILVKDFMSQLSKEGNITSMVVGVADGRMIEAKFIGKIDDEDDDDVAKSSSSSSAGEWSMYHQNKYVEVSVYENGDLNNNKNSALNALVDAAAGAPSIESSKKRKATATGKIRSSRKPRKVIPENKEYVECTQKDILFERGGRSNHHPGNKAYREIVMGQQAHYRSCEKNEKTKVAQSIVDYFNKEIGARFLEFDKECKRWYVAPNKSSRLKVGQALREDYTDEGRASKRARYKGTKLQSIQKEIEDAVVKVDESRDPNNATGGTDRVEI